jgi:hypothetical protein
MSSVVSSIAPQTKLMSSSVRVSSNCGLLAHVFLLFESFFGETFLFCGVTFPMGGYSSGVSSPPPCSYSSSSPPPFPSISSSPPPGELDPLSLEVLSSSSLSMLLNLILLFYFFIPLVCLTCSTHVTMGLPMVSMSDSSASVVGHYNCLIDFKQSSDT